MLVLSRRPNEKILFPGINTSVQVVTIKPGVVRLGIEAPAEVVVLREEVMDCPAVPSPAQAKKRDLNHQLRNRLNAATVGLALLRLQVKAGLALDSEVTLAKIDHEFQAIRRQMEEAAADKPRPPVPRKQRSALVVEDDRNERELLAGFLRMAGMEVVTAGDGCDALDYLREQTRPDVVLLDMVLPRCDGPTTIRAIRDDPSLAGIKIFALTGHAPERFGLNYKSAGIDRWFSKPLNPEALLHDLHREFGDAG